MSEVNVEELVIAYLELRNKRDKAQKEFEAIDEDLKNQMAEIETQMLSVCNTMNANSINTKYGTVIRKINERFVCSDWTNFNQFVLENRMVELFEKRIHQGNFRAYMAEHNTDGLPPGINTMREMAVSVRKASN